MKKSLSSLFHGFLSSFSQLFTGSSSPAVADFSDTESYGGHIRFIKNVSSAPMEIEVFNQAAGRYSVKTVPGSDYIPINSTDYIQIVCGAEPDATDIRGGEFYVYFYNQNKEPVWDILDHTDESTGERNRVSMEYLKASNGFQFTGVPDGSYIRIAKANNHACRLLIWDGCKTGYPMTGLTTVFNAESQKERLPADGSACVQVPKTALFLIAKPGYTFVGMTISNAEVSEKVSHSNCRFPSQVVRLRGFSGASCAKNIRVVKDYNYRTGKYSRVMPNVDLSDAVIAVDESVFQASSKLSSLLNPVFRNIQACMDFTWEAKADIADNWGKTGAEGIVGAFHKGVTYHGIPYRSSWNTASSVGWHVSKHTFMNAANDPDSIFYRNSNALNPGPYYNLVCSSFGTLVSGFSYPLTNFGMMRDPQLLIEEVDSPVIGSLMTKGSGHCFIPLECWTNQEGARVLTLAEQISPITAIRNVYEGIPKNWKGVGAYSIYPHKYVYNVKPATLSDIPYDINTYTIKNGSARPFRGDQSVYTSEMDVLINIKDASATRLYFQKFDVTCSHGLSVRVSPIGEKHYIEMAPGTEQVNLRSAAKKDGSFTGAALENGAVYGVWASRGSEQDTAPANVEFFEWYDLAEEKITYRVEDGALVTDDVFWYARASVHDEMDYMDYIIGKSRISGGVTIPYQEPTYKDGEKTPHSDYSSYAERAQLLSSDSVTSFFRKGLFGAYITAKEAIDG